MHQAPPLALELNAATKNPPEPISPIAAVQDPGPESAAKPCPGVPALSYYRSEAAYQISPIFFHLIVYGRAVHAIADLDNRQCSLDTRHEAGFMRCPRRRQALV